MAETVTIHAAKTNLSRLVARAEAGEEIVIARGDKPVAKLVPIAAPPARPERRPGRLKGQGWVGDEILEPLSEDELRLWEEGPVFPPPTDRA